MMEAARKERDEIDRKKSKKRPRPSGSGTVGDPIQLDLDSQPASAAASRPPSRLDDAASKRARTAAATYQGCQVCNDEAVHTLAACPVVLAGADSIKGWVASVNNC